MDSGAHWQLLQQQLRRQQQQQQQLPRLHDVKRFAHGSRSGSAMRSTLPGRCGSQRYGRRAGKSDILGDAWTCQPPHRATSAVKCPEKGVAGGHSKHRRVCARAKSRQQLGSCVMSIGVPGNDHATNYLQQRQQQPAGAPGTRGSPRFLPTRSQRHCLRYEGAAECHEVSPAFAQRWRSDEQSPKQSTAA